MAFQKLLLRLLLGFGSQAALTGRRDEPMGDIRADEPRIQESHSTEREINRPKSMCLWVVETLKTMSHPPLREEMKWGGREGGGEEWMEKRDDRRSLSLPWQVEERRVLDYMQGHTSIHPHSNGQDFNDFYLNFLFSHTVCTVLHLSCKLLFVQVKYKIRWFESLWTLQNLTCFCINMI